MVSFEWIQHNKEVFNITVHYTQRALQQGYGANPSNVGITNSHS